MAVTDNFSTSVLDLGTFSLGNPTALVWGADGRLYVTEVTGDVRVMTVAFGDKPGDGTADAKFYVTASETVSSVKSIPNYNDDGSSNGGPTRQVTGIDVTKQYNAAGEQLYIDAATGALTTVAAGNKAAVTMYVTSTDQRIGAGTGGGDANLDTNSGVISKLVQTGPNSWDPIDIVRGLARSEENHALNGLEVIQDVDANGILISERLIVANGGNANSGAPSNNFAGQQEQPYSAAILEVDLDALNAMTVKTDADSGRSYIYDLPTLDDPTRGDGTPDDLNDPQGGNDGLNSAKITADSPVQIYSPGYRNAYDVEITDDGRVWTYDNGANNSWGGRPIGEAGDNGGTVDFAQAFNYIATNLNNGDQDTDDDINLVNWNPSNKDNFHEVTRSDDLDGRDLSSGNGGPVTYDDGGLTYVYGGHPNPTRAEGALAGLLFSPGTGTNDAFLLVSNQDSYGAGSSDYAQVIAWLTDVENNNADYPDGSLYGATAGALTSRVLEVTPGIEYDIYKTASGGVAVPKGDAAPAGAIGGPLGQSGLPADIAEIVAARNPIEGDYREAGKTDGAVDTGNGSVNGLAEYTSTILDDGSVKMSGAILATDYNGELIIMGRDAEGKVTTTTNGQGFTIAADREVISLNGGSPLGLAAVGDDFLDEGLTQAFQGSIWVAKLGQNAIQILQPANGAVPLAGEEVVNPTDNDFDGVDHINDPFDFSATNGYAIAPGQKIELNFEALNENFPGSLSNTGLLGAALDGETPNRDATTVADNADPADFQDGLFDNGGNIIPGANAPRLQIKNVVAGSVVGSDNDARDVLHTGIRPSADTDRIVATFNIKNWVPSVDGGLKSGQLVGMMFGDGTQANFLRFVFGSVNGAAGFEVGYEIGDANYQTVAQIAVAALDTVAIGTVELRFEVDINTFAVSTTYRLEGQAGFTDIELGGFTLPEGVLRDVLTGDHTITDGDGPVLESGAAIGVLAETSAGNPLEAVDFNSIEIEAFGNELLATTGDEVDQAGSAGVDTLIYTGTDTVLDPLAANVERFDGTGSDANFALTANDLDNLIRVGSGDNVITTGGGADSVRGTLAFLDGDEIDDFSSDDEVIIEGLTLNTIGTPVFGGVAGESATITINGATITFSGPDLADYDPADGGALFNISQAEGGVRITLEPALSPVLAISAGGADLLGATVREQSVDFLSDVGAGGAAQYLTGVTSKSYTNGTIAGTDIPDTDLDLIHQTERSAVDTGKWGYAIPVEDGNYLVDLYFAEIFHGVAGGTPAAGSRVFDVFIENDTVETGLDVFAEAGGQAKELVKTYQATVTDGVLNIEFDATVDQAKLSGLVVWKVGGTFTPPPDGIAPEIISIEVPNPTSLQDGERFAIVTLSDETGFDAVNFTGLDGDELSFTGIVPDDVSAPVVVLSDGGKTATLTYTLTRDGNAWPNDVGEVSIAAGVYGDAAGNTTGAASAGFVLEANLASLVRGGLVRAINVGTTDTTAATNLGTDLVEGGIDNSRYGGAIASDSLITDAGGNPIALEADNAAYYTAPKTNGQLNANVDGQSGGTGSNSGGVDLDGSAYHTYRDSNADTWTATYSGFANGTYVVELHFAELFQSASGTRVGDFYIQGQLVLDNFDVFAQAGGADKQISRTHNVTVTDDTITVTVDSSAGASGAGQAGYSAIAVYDAVPSNLPPTVSVGDVTVAEGEDATLLFTRIGDLTEAVTVDYSVTPGSADAGDYNAAPTGQVIIPAGQGGVTLTIPTIDDEVEEGAETFTVTVTGVSTGANIGDGSATVTISPNDSDLQAPVGATIFELDFEGAGGEALAVGGFDGALGSSPTVIDEATSEITGGKLVVQTAEGDINDGADNDSLNDFTKSVDLSDPALTEVFLTARFDNPFDAAFFAAQSLTGTNVPNYAQQGIVLGDGTQTAAQQVKLVWGGVATGPDATGIQMWSKGSAASGGFSQQATIAQMIQGSETILDVASIEMSLLVNKADGTIAQYVTLFNGAGGIIGGTRPEPTAGFFTMAPVTPPANNGVLANIVSGTELTHVGVTSSDNSLTAAPVSSFEVSWDFLRLSSPQFVETGGDALVSISGPADIVEGGDTTATDLVFTLTADDGLTGDLEITLSVDDAQSVETVTFVNGDATFTVSVPQDSRWNGAESVTVAILAVGTAGYAPNPSAAAATGDVTEDDPVDVFAGVTIGDFSDDRLAPTDVGTLQLGESAITASQQGDAAPGTRDRDYITFTVAEGQALKNLFLDGYVTTESGPQAFMGLQAGPAITVNPLTGAPDDGQEGLLAGIVYGPDPGADLLSILAAGEPADAQGQDFPGFTLPLEAGTYTLWLNQGGPSTTLNLRLVTEALVPTVTISDAAPVLEADGDQLEFVLTASDGTLDGQTVTITYDTAAETGLTQNVTFTGTTGTLTIDVVNDDVADGDDTVTVTLTGASGGALVDVTPASGVVTEDDAPVQLVRGGVVAAFNAGGPALTQDGIDFAAAANATNGVPFAGGDQYTDGLFGQPDQAAFNDTVYETEINSGADTDTTPGFFTFSTSQGIDPTKTYFVDLYFAEIFESQAGTRLFNVTVEDAPQPVLTNLSVVTESGDVNLPFVAQLADPIAPGANGAIDLRLDAIGQRAKISAIVIREAVEPVDTPPTVAAGIADQTAIELGAFSLEVPANAFADDGGVGNLTLTAELADGSDLPAWLSFDGTTFTGTPPDGVASDLVIKVLADDGTNSPAETSFTLAIADDAVPGAISIGDAPTLEETGDIGVTTLLFPLTMVPPTAGDVTVNYIAGPVGLEGEAGSAIVTFDASGAGVLSIDVPNNDVDDVTELSVLLTGVTGTNVELGAAVVATGTVTEDDAIDPADIDGDGIVNINDPFAYDGTNGDAKALTAGGAFRQDFDVDTTDAFSTEAGFSGIIINQNFTPGGVSGSDPYGDRTTEAKTSVSGGVFKTESSDTDTFGSGTDDNNTLKDNYHSAADVTGVESFSITSRALNPFPATFSDDGVPGQYASFGITLGAGGVDDWTKLVFGAQGANLGVEFAGQNSFSEGADNLILTGTPSSGVVLADGVTAIAPLDIAVVEFGINVNKPTGGIATMQGVVVLRDAANAEIATITTATKTISGSLLAALAGENPLTGGDGGIAYGISITDWSGGAANRFTGEWDYLEISNSDAPPAMVSISGTPTEVESGDAGTQTALVFDLAYTGGANETRDVTYTVNGGDAQTASIVFTGGAGQLSVVVDNDDVDNGVDDIDVVLTGIGDNVADMVDPAANTATGTVTEDDIVIPPVTGEPIRIQAEDFTSSATYAAQPQNAAEGGEVIFLPQNGGTGSATYDLAAKNVIEGTYNVTIGYFDENDGVSTINLAVDSNPVGSITLDDLNGGNAAQVTSFRTKTFPDVAVGENGQLVISATTGGREFARIDWIEFTPVDDGGPVNTAPFAPNDLPDQTVDENTAFTFDAGRLFADAEQEDLSFTANSDLPGGALPAGLTFDTDTGVFGGVPTEVGIYQITVIASDDAPSGALSSPAEIFTLTVANVNEAPGLDQPIADRTLGQGAMVALDVTGNFSDPDVGDTLTYMSAGVLPTGMTFADGVFGGTIIGAAPGSYQVTVTATDDEGATISDTFLFNVTGGADSRPTVRIEAEDVGQDEIGTLVDGFFVEAGSRIRLLANDSGEATYDLSGVAAGDYLVRVRYFDENDGESSLGVALDGGEIQTITLDDDATSGNAAQATSARATTLANTITLGVGAANLLKLTGRANGGEFVRIDWIELVPVGGSSANFAPTEVGTGIPDAMVQGLGAIALDASSSFSDPEEDALTYAIVSDQTWLLIDEDGVISGQPPAGGVYNVVVSAEDASNNPGVLATSDFTLTVEVADNQAPTLDFPIGALSVAQEGFLEETVTFTDPEGGAVTYALGEGAPDWLSIDTDGTLSGQPGAGDVAANLQVEVIATDELNTSASTIVDVTVSNVNDAPEIGTALAAQSAVVGQAFTYALPAGAFTDADEYLGDTLVYSAKLANGDDLPSWLSISSTTGELSGTPASDADLSVVITATDGAGAGESVSADPLAIVVTTFTVPTDPVIIEAEDFTGLTTATNFVVNSLKGASDGQIIRMPANSDGVITTDLSAWAGGSYKVSVTYIDETDGASTARVLVDGVELGTWSFDGASGTQVTPDGATGSLGQAGNYRTIELDAPFGIINGSTLTLEVTSQGGEFGRVDLIELIPADLPLENQVPMVALANMVADIAEDADTTNPTKVADIVVTDDGLGMNTLALTGTDSAAFEIVESELFLKAGVALDFETKTQFDVSVTVDDITIDPTPDDTADFVLTVTDVVEASDDAFAPDGDLDGDGILNAVDLDVDNDLTPNADDPFAYDKDNGMMLESGEAKVFDFDIDGTIYQNGMTGFLQGIANGGAFNEDTGANSVSGGLLTVNPVTGGDTGGPNNPQDDAVVGVKNGTFVAKAVVLNPWFGTAPNPGGFDQLGLVLGLNSADMIKLVFGQTAGVVEFQKQQADVGTKYGGSGPTANVPLPAGVTLDTFAKAEIIFEVVSTDATSATVTGSVNFLDAAGAVLASANYGAAPIGGALAAALADPAVGVAVGFTHVDQATAPGFTAQLDSLTIIEGDGAVATVDTDAPTAAITLTNPADSDSPLLVSVALDDASGIDPTTLGADDLELTVSGIPAILPIIFGGFADGVASYSIAAPTGGWTEGLSVAVTLLAGQVADLATTPNTNAAVSQPLTLDLGGGSTGGGEDEVVFRINAGGDLVAATDGGPDWVADSIASPNVYLTYPTTPDNRNDTGGTAVSTFDGVPSAVFAEARSSDFAFSYDIPTSVLENGENYEVRLYFAEIFAGAQGGDFRNFDATVEGFMPAAFNNIDPGALFGGNAGVLTTQVKVTDGTLNIGFTQDVVQNPIISAIEVVKLSTDVDNPEPPVNPGNALEAFPAQDDLDTSATYGGGAAGSAVLEIMTGDNNIQSSNFGANSFEVTNTGGKKISAIFIDVSSALYPDSVFDPDGQGGDNAAKPWQINSGGGTGGFVNGTGYFLPGVDPIPNSGGSGGASNGGFKGAMVKFNASSSGGFQNGETVGFSGDMDPNSIAGMTKASVDGSAILSWDVGGISGHELIGSLFTVLFDDGTTASGQLASDGSSAGSHALATQTGSPAGAPGIAVNGVLPGQSGTYGDALPTVTVTGNPGDKVQITMTKGFNPVVETDNGIAGLVEDRLERYDFKASNAFDAQTKIVTIGADGTFDASTLFDYDDAINNNVGSGTFAGDDVAQIGFVATKVQNGGAELPIGPTTAPIYLSNVGGPVTGDPTGGTGGGGYFEIIGSGSSARFKVQIEDENANGGTNPPGDWTYVDGDGANGNQTGTQGGHYYWGSENTSTALNPPQADSFLNYDIFIPEGQEGAYTLRVRASRDTGEPSDQRNDVWVRIDDDAEALQVTDTNSVSSQGFVKVFGGGTGGWGNAASIDSVLEADPNFSATFNLDAGLHTITLAGRSQGFHIDFFDLYKGGAPSVGASNSAFINGDPGTGGRDGELRKAIVAGSDDTDQNADAGTVNLTKADMELGDGGRDIGLRFTDLDLESLEGVDIRDAYIEFTARSGSSGAIDATVKLEDTLSAATFSGASGPTDRDTFDFTANWNDNSVPTAGSTFRTDDLSDLIEAFVAAKSADLGTDDDLAFVIEDVSGVRKALSFEGGEALELVLIFQDDILG